MTIELSKSTRSEKADTKTTLLGNYKSADNLNMESATASGKTFEVKQSAKALFYEAGSYSTPSGYDWSSILGEVISQLDCCPNAGQSKRSNYKFTKIQTYK